MLVYRVSHQEYSNLSRRRVIHVRNRTSFLMDAAGPSRLNMDVRNLFVSGNSWPHPWPVSSIALHSGGNASPPCLSRICRVNYALGRLNRWRLGCLMMAIYKIIWMEYSEQLANCLIYFSSFLFQYLEGWSGMLLGCGPVIRQLCTT